MINWLRTYRLGEYAIFDLVLAFVGMFLLSNRLSEIFLKIGVKVPKENWLFLALPIGILVHLFTGTPTQMTKNFFDPQGHYPLKILILTLTILGLRNTRKI